ncbi:MAG: cytochrome b [Psychrobium sp.]
MKQSIEKYSLSFRLLHWAMAFLILLMLFAFVGFNPELTQEERMEMLVGHSTIGTIISVLLLWRVFKRFIQREARPDNELTGWQKRVAKVVHYGLYVMMIIVPMTGYLTANLHKLPVLVFANFNIGNVGDVGHFDLEAFTLMREIHQMAILTLVMLLLLHIGGALYHRFVKKDHVFSSMLRGKIAK